MAQSESNLYEEVEFWRRFVADWQRERSEPVPQKLHDLLAHAERKLVRRLQNRLADQAPAR